MIKLSQTFEIVTEESAENGEASESGFDFENEDNTFKETLERIESGGFVNPSDSSGVPRWLSTEAEQDMHTGEYTSKSLHPGKDARSQRYWAKACRAAGLVK